VAKRIEPLSSRAQIVDPANGTKESAMPKAIQPQDSVPVNGNGTAKEPVAHENGSAVAKNDIVAPPRRDQIQLKEVALPKTATPVKETPVAKSTTRAVEKVAPIKESEVARKAAAVAAITPTTEEAPVQEPAKGLAAPRKLGSRRSRGGGPDKPGKPKKKWSFWRFIWAGVQVTFIIGVILATIAGYFVYQKALEFYAKAETFDLKKLDDLNVTSTFYDVNGEELGRIFVEDRIVLKPDEIPNTMRQAAMAAEDRRYYQHGAIDYWGIIRAIHENIGRKSKAAQGGSTIEQQLAKHLIGDFSRTLDRKFLEAFVANRLEHSLTKEQILNYYLNTIYFGKGYFGVGAAARGYFGKEAKDMTPPECAMLAGIIRAPNILNSGSPKFDPALAKWRRNATLKQMEEEKFITPEQYSQYINEPLHIQPSKPSGLQSYVMVAAVKELEQILSIEGTEEMPQGLTVHTNINLKLQRAIEDQINMKLASLEPAPVPAANPANATDDATVGAPKAPLQGAAVVADVNTGRVMAWVGGRDFAKSQFDHISMAKRENGALIQPLLYALAFDRLNIDPATMINASYIDPSAPASAADLALGNPNTDLTKWFLSVQDALALGNPSVATRVGLQIGTKNFADWLRQAGVETKLPEDKPNVFNPEPMSLGDMTSLYQILGNGGVKSKLKIIQSIESRTGEVLYDDGKPDKDNQALLNNLDDQQMTLTLENALRIGSARTLTRDYGFKSGLAGMPGYSVGYRDAWFVGYTPNLLAGVWIGYDDSRPLGKDVALKSAVPLWGDIMQQVTSRKAAGGPFPVPPQLTKVEVDRSTGALCGLAGLAPAPGDIFVYLKKNQVDAAGALASSGQVHQAPKEWSDWLTTMFQDGDETALSDDQLMNSGNKRDAEIPAVAEYKMPGLRGDILSADGQAYATMRTEKNLVLGWPGADEATSDDDILKWMHTRLDEVQAAIGVQLTIDDKEMINQYHTQRYQPYLVLEDLTPAQVTKFQGAGLDSKGFGLQTVPLRSYPRGTELAHTLGYLSRSQQRNKGKYLGGDVIYDRYKGAVGLEAVYDQDLVGKDGKFMVSTTPEGYARSSVVDTPATYGNNVRLTIDSKIQSAIEAGLADSDKIIKAGIMIDVHNGNIVGLASQPTYDPNIFVPTIAADEWNLLNSNQYNPLIDRTIHAQYPPGSGFKTVTSIAAMNAGVFDPNWVVHCPGYLDVGSVHFPFPKEHGDITFQEGFAHSYNTYFMSLGLKVGRDVELDTARSLNFGNLTGINLPGELPGLLPDNEFVKRVHGRDFGDGDLANTSIGQGDVLVTPLQMVSLMMTIANNGTMYKPQLVKQIEDRNGNVVKSFPPEVLRTVTFDAKNMPTLIDAMEHVIDDGTATIVHRDDMKIAAKTGTAQVGSHEHPRQIAWLSGFIPADNPQYAFSFVVEGQTSDNSSGANKNDEDAGLLGGVQAGKIARDVFSRIWPLPGGKKANDEAQQAVAPAKQTDDSASTDTADKPDKADKSADADQTAKVDTDNIPVAKPVKAATPAPTPSASSKASSSKVTTP
jgi:penicillin-binding protein 2